MSFTRLVLAIFSLPLEIATCEVVTSAEKIKNLHQTDGQLVLKLEALAEIVKNFSDTLFEMLKVAKEPFTSLQDRGEVESLDHPVDQIVTVFRFYRKWANIFEILDLNSFSSNLNETNNTVNNLIITGDEFAESIKAIFRLQEMFGVPAKSFIDGNLQGAKSSLKMSLEEVYEIGAAAAEEKFALCVDWMSENKILLEGLDEVSTSEDAPTINDVIDQLQHCEFQLGNFDTALKHAYHLLAIDNDTETILKNVNYIKKHMKYPTLLTFSDKDAKKKHYAALCKGLPRELENQALLKKKLNCYLSHERHPLLYLQPIKVEVVSEEPYVVLWKGFISDYDIEFLKNLSFNNLSRSQVGSLGNHQISEIRTSQIRWMRDAHYPLVEQLSNRISAASGLSVKGAEPLQVANYGIGGHYEPHWDYHEDVNSQENGSDDRVATALLYFSDVALGGNTVFLHTNISVKPEKGAVLFWYNLNPDGSGIDESFHAACPVLLGVKWAANKWIHYFEQYHTYKCPAMS